MNAPFQADDVLAVDMTAAKALFEILASAGQIHLCAIVPDGGTYGRDFGTDIDAALDWTIERNGAGQNIHWTVNRVRPGVQKKPGKDNGDMIAARFAHVDLDPPKDGSAWDADAVLAELLASQCPPSFVIASGNGFQALWALSEPVEQWQHVEAVNRGLIARFGGDKGTWNIDRLLRVPGTVNRPNARKREAGRVPVLAGWQEHDDGVVYTVDELQAAFPAPVERDNPANGPSPEQPNASDEHSRHLAADDLGLGALSSLRSAIEHPPGWDRSGDGCAVARLMANAGYSDAAIIGILLNPVNAVSAHYLAQRDPRRAALRTVELIRGDGGSNGAPVDQPEPVDLWQRYAEPDLPTGLLPDVIERFAFRHGAVMGADPAGLAMAALTVCAAALPDSIVLQVKRNDPSWREAARLWTALVGPPSRKKTPIFKAAIAPLRKIDNALMQDYLAALATVDALPAAERKTAPRPKQRRAIISDATMEAAQDVLRDSPDGVLSEQDELSGWFGAMDKYAPGKGAQADRAFWLKAFNGGTYNLNRVARGAVQIPNLSISLLGGIQPEPLRKIAGDTVDDGLVQRLLPVILKPSAVGHDVPADGVVDEYAAVVGRLHVMRPPMRNGVPSLAEVQQAEPLHFDADAKAIRERLEREHLGLVEALEIASPKLASHFGKYDGLFARFCLLWHCIENADQASPPPVIAGMTAERVATFMAEFIRPSAIAFYAGMLGMSAGHEDLIALASLIVAKHLDEVKARDVQRAGQTLRHVTADEVRTLCEKLEAFGWLHQAEPGPKSATSRWTVNPRVHAMFADRAQAESERRQLAREALRDALQS